MNKMREQSARDRLLQIIEDGYIDPGYVIMAFVKWNTNEDIKEMCHANEIELWLNDDEEEVEVDAGELAGETSGGYPCYLPDDFLDGSSSSC
tara:strand:- start:168 stop:443 length:276 start_codon:yes stop_codon:yes gene_type:complete